VTDQPTTMPLIPEFSKAKDRHEWIFNHAEYFTCIFRRKKSYNRQELPDFEAAVRCAQSWLEEDETLRLMIYAVCQGHDSLAATVSKDKGVVRHE
jgi:hypothetical protein